MTDEYSPRDAIVAQLDSLDKRVELLQKLAETEQKLAMAEKKLAYVDRMGLKLGMLKTADKPEPVVAHYWEEGCDQDRIFKEWSASIGHEFVLAKLQEKLTAALDCLQAEEEWRLASAEESETLRIRANRMREQFLSGKFPPVAELGVVEALEKKVRDLEWHQQCNLKDEANMLGVIKLYRDHIALIEGVFHAVWMIARRTEKEAARNLSILDELRKVKSWFNPPPSCTKTNSTP
jgi:hypothetical protein